MEEARAALPGVRQEMRVLRQIPVPALLAGNGSGEIDVLPRVQDATRRVSGPRRAGGVGAVGQA